MDAVGLDVWGVRSPALGPGGGLYYNTRISTGVGGTDIFVAPP